MRTSSPPRTQPYHHGDLRNALIQAAVAMAGEGGPGAIVLREAARRVGVSPTAAYRHFTALPELVAEVRTAALRELALAMEAELAACEDFAEASEGAWERMRAIGRGYVHFALAEPGLFATAFTPPEGVGHVPGGTGASGLNAHELLERALDELVDVAALDPADREPAATAAWASVHGLSQLFLGPMHDLPSDQRERAIESTLDLVGRGLLVRSSPASGR